MRAAENRLALHPDLFALLPGRTRRLLVRPHPPRRGSPWPHGEVENAVRVSESHAVVAVEWRSDADAVIVAAGLRFSLDRLTFLAPEIRAGIELEDGWPVFDCWFRARDRRLFFVRFAAEHRFGPIARFIPGTRLTASRVREALDG